MICAPWAIILAGISYALVAPAASLKHDPEQAALLLLGLLLTIAFGAFVAVPTIATAWFRWALQRRRPRTLIALPDRAALGVAWRLFTFVAVLTASTKAAVRIARASTSAAAGEPAVTAAVIVALVLAILFASRFALRLPALAVNDATFTSTVMAVSTRKLWPALPIGLVVSLLPYPAVFWAAGWLINPASPRAASPALGPVDVLALTLLLLACFAAIASAAAFLSRAYLAAKDQFAAETPSA